MMYDKLGPHLIGGSRVALGHPWGVKCVNVSALYLAQLRAELGPNALLYVRFEHDDPRAEILYGPEEAARDWFARRLPDMEAMRQAAGPEVVFELPPNEPSTAMLPWVVRFYRVLLALMYGHGFRVAVGNPSVGEWHENTWSLFAPILAMLHPGSYLSLHEYWANHAQLDGPDARWFTARWTQPQIAEVIGVSPIIVSECGRDTPGWLDAGISAEEYLAELAEYDALLRQYPQVRGAFVFTLDSADPWWSRFVVDAIWPAVVAGQAEGCTQPQPPPAEPLPQDETATDPATLVEKGRWWLEEMQRAYEAGRLDRANAIRLSLIGLFYRIENALKEAR